MPPGVQRGAPPRRRSAPLCCPDNDVYDTDAMSIAVPYSAVVVAYKAVADALRRVRAEERHGTVVTGKLEELAEMLPETVQHARTLPDPSGWGTFAPGLGFSPLTPEQLVEQLRAHGGQPCGFSLPRGTSTANSSQRVAQIRLRPSGAEPKGLTPALLDSANRIGQHD